VVGTRLGFPRQRSPRATSQHPGTPATRLRGLHRSRVSRHPRGGVHDDAVWGAVLVVSHCKMQIANCKLETVENAETQRRGDVFVGWRVLRKGTDLYISGERFDVAPLIGLRVLCVSAFQTQ